MPKIWLTRMVSSSLFILEGARAGERRVRHLTHRSRHQMGHVQKRLASTAAKLAHVSVSTLKQFPPKEAIVARASKTASKEPSFFHAETWGAIQSPPPAALTAFAHRIGVSSIIPTTDIIQQACTHPSILSLYDQFRPSDPRPAVNGNLESLGNSLLGLFATEYVNSSFPHLPTRVMKAAVSAYVGPTTCANIAREMGASPLIRWHRLVRYTVSFYMALLTPIPLRSPTHRQDEHFCTQMPWLPFLGHSPLSCINTGHYLQHGNLHTSSSSVGKLTCAI